MEIFQIISKYFQKTTSAESRFPDGSLTCDSLREDIMNCMIKTDCMHLEKKTASQCFKEKKVPEECLILKNLFTTCKSYLIDSQGRFHKKNFD